MIDCHIHLDQYNIETLSQDIEKWGEAGVKGVIAVSNNLKSSYQILELKQKYPYFIYAGLGFHPESPLPTDMEFEEWYRLLKLEKHHISLIGEVGIPHYNQDNLTRENFRKSIELFEKCLMIGKSIDLPVSLHAVHDKTTIALDLLQKFQIKNAHFHWLKAPKDVVKEIVAHQYFISVTPEICYRKRDQQLVSQIPLHLLMIETDGPWSFLGPFQEAETTPLLLPEIISTLSSLKNKAERDLKKILFHNTKRFLLD